MAIDPFRSQVPIEKKAQLLCDPGRRVNTVRDGCNGHLVLRNRRPYDLPHPACHSAVKMAHAVAPAGHSQCEHGHVEGIAEFAELQELLPGDTEIVPVSGEVLLHHVHRESIVSCRHGRMCCENARRTNLFGSFVERLPLLNQLARALQQHE